MSRFSVCQGARRLMVSGAVMVGVLVAVAGMTGAVRDAVAESNASRMRVPEAAAASGAGHNQGTAEGGETVPVPPVQPAETLTAMAGHSTRLGNWHIHRIPDLRLGQPTLDPKSGAIYHPVAVSGTSISFYVIGAGEQELWEVPIIWAGQPTGPRYHKLNYFGILEETGTLYIYSRETE